MTARAGAIGRDGVPAARWTIATALAALLLAAAWAPPDAAAARRRGAGARALTVEAPARAQGSALVRIRVARPDAVVRVRLNGRRVPVAAVPARGRTRLVRLTADEGLRHGRNRLRVQARNRPRGPLAVARRTLLLRRTAPIPGAGPDARAKLRRVVVLDGRATRAATRPPHLRFRWRLVRRPRGSKARLRRATTVRPRFTPDRPGRYRVRLTVTELRPRAAGGRARRAGAAEAAGAPRATPAQTAAAVLGSASDIATITVTPPNVGIGVAVDTLDPAGGIGVTVGPQHYPAGDGALQLVVLDRETLELRSNQTYGNDPGSVGQLAGALGALRGDAIAIVTTPRLGAVAPIPDAGALATFNRAIAKLGAPPVPAAVAQSTTPCANLASGVCGGFSVIGTPGFAVGEGDANHGLGALGGRGQGGQLTGYLQLDQTETWHTFVPGDHVAFDTTAAGTSRFQAAIAVAGQTYRSEVLLQPRAGAYVLVLDAGTLALRDQGTYSLRYDDPDAIVKQLEQMTALLTKYQNDPSALVFTQAIGPIVRWDAYDGRGDLPYWWNRMADAEQALGGHRTLLHALAGDLDRYGATYARVGPAANGAGNGYPAAPWTRVASPAATRTAGQLAGTLARNPYGQLYPANASTDDDFSDDLTALAYQPATPWPTRDTPARLAVHRCVAAALELPYPIEDNYVNQNLITAWGNKQETLDGLTLPTLRRRGCDVSAFTQADLDAVSNQLDDEFGALPIVWQLVRNLQTPFLWASPSAQLDLVQIATDVTDAVRPPQTPVTYDGGAIAEDVFLLLGAIPFLGPAAEGAELVGAALGLVNDTALADDGTPALAPTRIDSTQLGQQLASQYETAALHFEQIGDMLVGDWGKLQAAARAATGSWAWTDASTQRAVDMLGLTARRLAYTTLFPKAFAGMLRAVRGTSDTPIPDDGSQFVCYEGRTPWRPFAGVNLYGGATVVTQAGPVRENWIWSQPMRPNDPVAGGGGIYPDPWQPSFPGAPLLAQMFAVNAPEADVPPLQPVEFTLAIRAQLSVLTIEHVVTTTGPDGTGDVAVRDFCMGYVSGWPGSL